MLWLHSQSEMCNLSARKVGAVQVFCVVCWARRGFLRNVKKDRQANGASINWCVCGGLWRCVVVRCLKCPVGVLLRCEMVCVCCEEW